jgi:hypothetical protein
MFQRAGTQGLHFYVDLNVIYYQFLVRMIYADNVTKAQRPKVKYGRTINSSLTPVENKKPLITAPIPRHVDAKLKLRACAFDMFPTASFVKSAKQLWSATTVIPTFKRRNIDKTNAWRVEFCISAVKGNAT